MRTRPLASRPWNWLLVGAFALAVCSPWSGLLAQDDEPAEEIELAEEDAACLECHDDPKLSTQLESGETLSLQGDKPKAIGMLERSLETDKGHAQAAALIARLKGG